MRGISVARASGESDWSISGVPQTGTKPVAASLRQALLLWPKLIAIVIPPRPPGRKLPVPITVPRTRRMHHGRHCASYPAGGRTSRALMGERMRQLRMIRGVVLAATLAFVAPRAATAEEPLTTSD